MNNRKAVEAHNETVTKNIRYLNIVINVIRFCTKFELAAKTKDESSSFHRLIDFRAELDEATKDLHKVAGFRCWGSSVQLSDVLQCILQVYLDEISSEIKNSTFVSVMMDETANDVSTTNELILVYRYLVRDKLVERFWGFLKPSRNDLECLAECIKNELDRHFTNEPQKLIAQTYDGVSLLKSSPNGLHNIIKNCYKSAHYAHSYVHELNAVLLNASCANRDMQVFLATIGGFYTFFSKSRESMVVFYEVIRSRSQRILPTWECNPRIVNIVFEYKDELLECLELIVEQRSDIQHFPTIDKACGLKRALTDGDFLFWLSFFYNIMPAVDSLHNQLPKKRESDKNCVKSAVDEFVKAVNRIRDGFGPIESMFNTAGVEVKQEHAVIAVKNEPIETEACDNVSRKRKRDDSYVTKTNEVCDALIAEVTERYCFIGHLAASNLLYALNFPRYVDAFPNDYLEQTVQAYPCLDEDSLRSELTVIYDRNEFRKMSGSLSLYSFFCSNGLEGTFKETVKLLKIIITIPVSSAEAERCVSSLKRIKSFLSNVVWQENMAALTALSVERNFILSIADFNNKVIKNLSSIGKYRMNLSYT